MSAIGSLASGMQQAQIGQQIGVAIARKGLDAMKQQGQAAVSLLEQAAEVQQNVIRADPHKGHMLDVIA
jgi:hypothetical protein